MKYQVRFAVEMDDSCDSYRYNTINVHGLSSEEAQVLVKIVGMIGDCGEIGFEDATMMGDSSDATRPDWRADTRQDGTEIRSKDHEVHVYPPE